MNCSCNNCGLKCCGENDICPNCGEVKEEKDL